MTGSFEHEPKGKIEADNPVSAGEKELKRRQFVESAKLRRLLGVRRELLSEEQVTRLGEARLKELEKLERRGVLGKMISLIPNVGGKLLERERKEVSEKLQEEIEFKQKELEADLSSIEQLKEGINSGKLSESDVQWAQQRIEEHKKNIQEEDRRIAELKAELQKLSKQGEIST